MIPREILRNRELALWASNGLQCVLVALNTLSWGFLIKSLGQLTFSIPFVVGFLTNVFFYTAMGTGFISVLFSYFAIAKIGLAKSALFYHTGAIVVLATAYFGVGERFTLTQLIAIALILLGSVLVSRKGSDQK